MALGNDVLIRIQTAFDKGGIAAAEAELNKLANAGAKASRSGDALANTYERVGRRIGAALSVAAVGTFVKSAVDAADQLNVVSKRTGITVEALSRLKFAAEQTETDFDTLTRGLQRLNINVGKTGIEGAKVQDVFIALAEKIKNTSSAAEQAQIANQAVGRGIGAELLPFLKEGAKGFEELTGKSADFAEVSTKSAQQADAFNDALGKLSAGAKAAAISIAGPLLEAISGVFSPGNKIEIRNLSEEIRLLTKDIEEVAGPAQTAQIAAGLISPEEAEKIGTGVGDLTKKLQDLKKARNELTLQGPASSQGAQGPPIDPQAQAATDRIVEGRKKETEAEEAAEAASKKSASAAKAAATERASAANIAANAAQQFSENLTKEIAVSDAQVESINRGGEAGARFKIVQEQTAQAIAAGVPVTAALQAEFEKLADSQARLASVQVTEQLKTQTAELNTQREAIEIGGAAGKRYAVVQEEISNAVAAGAEKTPALTAAANEYADAQERLAGSNFSQGLKEQSEEIAAQREALDLGSQSSAQYEELQKQIVEQLQSGIPVTQEQRQALEELGQEGLRYAFVQGKIAEAQQAGIDLNFEQIQSIRQLGDEFAKLGADTEVKNLGEEAAKKTAEEADRQSEALTQSLTDAIFRGFENGKGFAENFKDTLVNTFKTLILRPTIEFLVKPVAEFASKAIQGILGTVQDSILGGFKSLLGAGAQSLIGSFGGEAVSAAGTAQGASGSIVTDALQHGFGSVVSSLDTVTASINQLGFASGLTGGPSGQAGLLGSGSASSLLSTLGGGAAIAGLSFGLGKFIGGKTGSALQGAGAGLGAGAATGAAVGSVVPVIGTAIGAIIGAIAGAFGGGMGYQTPPRGFAKFTGTGTEALGGKKGFDVKKSLVPLGVQIQKSLAAVDKDLGLGLIEDRIKFWIGFKAGKGYRTTVAGKGDVNFEDPGRLQAEIFRQEIKDADSGKKKTPFQKKVLARALPKETFEEQLKSIDKDLQVRNKLRAFTKQVEFDPTREKIKELRAELRKLSSTFHALKRQAEELDLPTKKATAAFKKAKQHIRDEILGAKIERDTEKVGVQQQAYQAAGRMAPQALDEQALRAQFAALGIEFRRLGIDASGLSQLLAEAIANLGRARQEAALNVQAQAYQAAGVEVPMEVQRAMLQQQFEGFAVIFQQLGLDVAVLGQLFTTASQNLERAAAQADLANQQAANSAIQRAYQLAGSVAPLEVQAAALRIEFAMLSLEFQRLGMDAAMLGPLLEQALANLPAQVAAQEAAAAEARQQQQHAAAQAAASAAKAAAEQAKADAKARRENRVAAQERAYGLAGENPLFIQSMRLSLEIVKLQEEFRELGLNTKILAGIAARATRRIAIAYSKADLEAQTRAYSAAGRANTKLERELIILEFQEIAEEFKKFGKNIAGLPTLMWEALNNQLLQTAKSDVAAQAQAYSMVGRTHPVLERERIRLEFMEITQELKKFGKDVSGIPKLLAEALENFEAEREKSKRDAIGRAYELAGEEIPKEVQIAGVTAEFSELSEVFKDLGLDGSILGDLLQKAVDKINKAGEDLKSGGFIGFIDELGRVSELDPRMRDIGSAGIDAANDSQFFGAPREIVREAADRPYIDPRESRGLGDLKALQGYATGVSNRIVSKPELFLAGERGPESVNVRPLTGNRGGDDVDVHINLNGPAIFDDISQAKFTRSVAKGLQSRRTRFG